MSPVTCTVTTDTGWKGPIPFWRIPSENERYSFVDFLGAAEVPEEVIGLLHGEDNVEAPVWKVTSVTHRARVEPGSFGGSHLRAHPPLVHMVKV